jgi:peptidoglycan-associated lipoprotein
MINSKTLIVCSFVALLGGCASQDIPDPEPTDTTYDDASGSGADTGAYDETGLRGGEFFDEDPSAGELASVIYFDFDSSELRPEDADTVTRHAMQLANNPQLSVRLEGHADERGSREYNIGLGERRSQTVRRMLLIQGASASQISTVSFGEERPVAFGSTEEAYSQNRRVEFKYSN